MRYWTKTFPTHVVHLFDLEPGEERLVEHCGPSREMQEWLEREKLDPTKLLYKTRPGPTFFTTDKTMAKKLFQSWG